jgi:hypothetical protein
MANLEESITEIIELIQISECLNCKYGQALVKFRDIRDGLCAVAAPDPAPTPEPIPCHSSNQKTKQVDKTVEAKKVCKKCRKEQSIGDFEKNKLCSDGHLGTCKKCRSEADKRRLQKQNPKHGNFGRPDVDLKFRCEPCHAKFLTKKQLDDHVKTHHVENDAANSSVA